MGYHARMPAQPTRSTLLTRIRDGVDPQQAWLEFDATYSGLIRRYCARRGLQPADAEDVQQIVLASLMRSLRDFDYSRTKGRFRDYLGRIVHNAVIKQRTRPRQKPELIAPEVIAERAGETVDDAEWQQEWVEHHFRRAMDDAHEVLDPLHMQVFRRLLAGDAVRHLAASFELTESAVYKIKHRVRDYLKVKIAQQVRDEAPTGSRT